MSRNKLLVLGFSTVIAVLLLSTQLEGVDNEVPEEHAAAACRMRCVVAFEYYVLWNDTWHAIGDAYLDFYQNEFTCKCVMSPEFFAFMRKNNIDPSCGKMVQDYPCLFRTWLRWSTRNYSEFIKSRDEVHRLVIASSSPQPGVRGKDE